MKKTALILSVLAAASSGAMAQSSVTLYGILDVAVRHTSNEGPASKRGDSVTRVIGGGMSQSRLGINVTEDMGDGLKALVNLETRINADAGVQGSTNFWQQSWVGLQGGFGRITLGRQYNILFDLVTSTYASYPYSPYNEAYKPEIGFSLGARADNMVKYMAEIGPFRGGLQISAGEGGATTPKTFGGYLRYSADGISIGAGYQENEFNTGRKIKAMTVGGSYRSGPLYLNAGYANNKLDRALSPASWNLNTTTNPGDGAVVLSYWTGGANGGFPPVIGSANERELYMVGGGFQITPQLNLGAHYYWADEKGITAAANGEAKFLSFVADYAFSKRTDAYAGVDNTRLSGNTSLAGANGAVNGAKSRNGFMVGVRHRF